MGMSGDFELAIEEGSTEVRIGTPSSAPAAIPSRNSRTASRAPGRPMPAAAPEKPQPCAETRRHNSGAKQRGRAERARPRIHIDPARGDTPCTSTRSACWRWPPCPWPPRLPAPNPGPPSRSAGSCPTRPAAGRRGRAHGRRRHGKAAGPDHRGREPPRRGHHHRRDRRVPGRAVRLHDRHRRFGHAGLQPLAVRQAVLRPVQVHLHRRHRQVPAAAGGECELAVQVGGRRDRGRQERAWQADRRLGSPHHLALELFKQRTGAELLHVPYRAPRPPSRTCWADRWT